MFTQCGSISHEFKFRILQGNAMTPGTTPLDDALDFILRTYDSSQKNKLDRVEALRFFKELFEHQNVYPSQESLEELFEIVDFNGDGYITMAELSKIIKTTEFL